MHISVKYLIFEFNNLCRKDNRIKSWAMYVEDGCYVRVDVNFIDYNHMVYDYHCSTPIELIERMNKDEVIYFAKQTYQYLQSSFEVKDLCENKNEESI